MSSGQNKPKMLRAIWAPGLKDWEPSFYFPGQTYIFYTSGIEMSQHFQGPCEPLVFTFCGQILRTVCPRAPLMLTPDQEYSFKNLKVTYDKAIIIKLSCCG